MRTDHSRRRRPGVAAAVAVLAAAGIIGGVSTAGARENKTLYSVEGAAPCFSETKSACAGPPQLAMQTGDTLTWDFGSGVPIDMLHNAQPKAGATTADANWNTFTPAVQVGGTRSFTFTRAGVYEFVCGVHPTMTGTVTVTGDPVKPTATPATRRLAQAPTPAPTFQATVAPGATAAPDDHLDTPAPGKAAGSDTQAPLVTSPKINAVSQGARISFQVSEAATIQVKAFRKGGKRPVTAATLHVAAGKRSVVVRSSSLRRKGTYTLQWQAVDAMGNKTTVLKQTLKVKR